MRAVYMECGKLSPAFGDEGCAEQSGGKTSAISVEPPPHSKFPKIQYSIKSIYFMVPTLKQRLFLGILSGSTELTEVLFAENRLKSLCMSILHAQLSFSNQA